MVNILIVLSVSIILGALTEWVIITPKDLGEDEEGKPIDIKETKQVVEYVEVNLESTLTVSQLLYTVLIFAAVYVVNTTQGMIVAIVCGILIMVSIWDFKYTLVLDIPIAVIALLGVLLMLSNPDLSVQEIFTKVSMALGVLFVLVMFSYFTGNSIGGGDIKIFGSLALFLFPSDFFLLFFLSWVIAFIFILPVKLIFKTNIFAIVPYITLSFIITIHFSEQIIEWYIH